MNQAQKLFMQALKSSLLNSNVEWEDNIVNHEWLNSFRLAEQHNVLPMIFEAVYNYPAARQMDPPVFYGF